MANFLDTSLRRSVSRPQYSAYQAVAALAK
jgi:hypothetical protein